MQPNALSESHTPQTPMPRHHTGISSCIQILVHLWGGATPSPHARNKTHAQTRANKRRSNQTDATGIITCEDLGSQHAAHDAPYDLMHEMNVGDYEMRSQ